MATKKSETPANKKPIHCKILNGEYAAVIYMILIFIEDFNSEGQWPVFVQTYHETAEESIEQLCEKAFFEAFDAACDYVANYSDEMAQRFLVRNMPNNS